MLTQSREDIRFNGHSEALQHVPNPNIANGWDPAHTWNNRFGNNKKIQRFFKIFYYSGGFLPQVCN